MLNKKNLQDLFVLIVLVLLVILTRTVLHLGNNIEFLTGATIASALVFSNKKLAFFVPVISLFLSDLILGNTYIYLFTWSGFLLTSIFGIISNNKINNNQKAKKIISVTLLGLASTILFFLWTNLGVVIQTDMYTKDFNGLMTSYIAGLPFLRNQLIGNLFIVPILYVITSAIYKFDFKSKNSIKYESR